MVAYLVIGHKNVHQIVRLIRRLTGERSAFFVHIDAKTDISAHDAELRAMPRTQLAAKRRYCPLSTFEIVRATLDLMAWAVTYPDVRRLTLLAGQDYPIKRPERIEAFLLDEHPDRAFIENYRLPRADWPGSGGLDRIEDWHTRIAGRTRKFPISRVGIRRSLPYGLDPYQGGQFWSMTRACGELVLDYVEEHPRLERFFRHAKISNESFFQTIVMNSALAPTVANDDLRFERWGKEDPHPAVLTTDDLPALQDSSALFAKKFDTDVDAEILDRIDAEILGVTPA